MLKIVEAWFPKLRVQKSKNLGRWACVEVPCDRARSGIKRVYGTVIDLIAGTDKPKRVRVQFGAPELAGEVLMPGQYRFAWWADEEED